MTLVLIVNPWMCYLVSSRVLRSRTHVLWSKSFLSQSHITDTQTPARLRVMGLHTRLTTSLHILHLYIVACGYNVGPIVCFNVEDVN